MDAARKIREKTRKLAGKVRFTWFSLLFPKWEVYSFHSLYGMIVIERRFHRLSPAVAEVQACNYLAELRNNSVTVFYSIRRARPDTIKNEYRGRHKIASDNTDFIGRISVGDSMTGEHNVRHA